MTMTFTRPIILDCSITGLTSLAYTIRDADGVIVLAARTNSGIVEDAASGTYEAFPTFDTAWGKFVLVVWDDGSDHFRGTEVIDLSAARLDIEQESGSSTVTTGNGDVLINHDYREPDALRIVEGGQGIDDALVTAYRAGQSRPDAQTRTGSDGRWSRPMMLDPGTYTLIVSAAGRQASVHSLEVDRAD